jgi:prephenate dehydratase
LPTPEKRRITGHRIPTTKENAMANKLNKVDYFYTTVSNTPGQAAKILAGLADAGVNLVAFSGFPDGRRSQVDFVPEDSAKFLRAAKAMQLKVSKKKVGFLYRGDDKVGALTKLLSKLAAAKVNLIAIDAVTAGKGRFGAIFWVKPGSVNKAAKLLGAS